MKRSFVLRTFARDVVLYLRSRNYAGGTYECPLCGFLASSFLPSPDGLRMNARCPRCNSLERHRAQWLFGLKQVIDVENKMLLLLHIAPEHCISSRIIKVRNSNYYVAEYRKNKYSDYVIDIQKTGLEGESFDAVICNHVLEHVDDDRAALRECHRLLKPGGIAFIQVPLDGGREVTLEDNSAVTPENRKERFGQEDHLRLYGNDFSARVESAGFFVESIAFWNRMSLDDFKRYALLPGEPVFLCRKGMA